MIIGHISSLDKTLLLSYACKTVNSPVAKLNFICEVQEGQSNIKVLQFFWVAFAFESSYFTMKL